ncbi:bacterial Ig-like domain-containing protein [Listeria aquatica]|nr:bacterial Ig-like domain-containing protein [Listeria aquatica]
MVIPLPKGVTFLTVSDGNVSATMDKANQQVVLDWKENQKCNATIQLQVREAGEYTFKAYTIRNDQTASSKPLLLHLLNAQNKSSDTNHSNAQLEPRNLTPDADDLATETGSNGSNPEEVNRIKESLASSGTQFLFKVARDPSNEQVFKISNVSLSQSYKGYKSINITLPPGLDLIKSSLHLPAGAELTQGGQSISIINRDSMSTDTVSSMIAALQFQYKQGALTGGTLKIAVEEQAISNWVDEKGIHHYYVFVPNALPWENAYNEAKSFHYRGLTGYLATISSLDEHDFIFNSIAKEPGFLGGTRLVHMNGQKISDDSSIPNTHYSQDGDRGFLKKNPNQQDWKEGKQWYWADGPESGTIFYNTVTYDPKNGPVKGVYSNFTVGEPNYSYGTETVLQFAQSETKFWNDLPDSIGYWFSNHGYYVEFSQYGNQKEINNSTSEHAESLPGNVNVRYIDTHGNLLQFTDGTANPKSIGGDLNAPYTIPDDKYKRMTINAKTGPYYLDETKLPQNTKGNFTNKEQNVDYVYQADLSTIEAKNSTLYVGESWQPKDNFVSAKDRTGKVIPFKSDMTSDKVNMNKAGTYKVIYQNGPASKSITVTVLTGTLKFVNVPEIMEFANQKISNKMTESNRTEVGWKMQVEDTRPNKTKWRVTAQLVSPFTNTSGDKLPNSLVFRKPGQADQLIGATKQVDVYDGTSSQNQRNYEVGWGKQSGPLLQISPGAAKTDSYTGKIQWVLVNAPV